MEVGVELTPTKRKTSSGRTSSRPRISATLTVSLSASSSVSSRLGDLDDGSSFKRNKMYEQRQKGKALRKKRKGGKTFSLNARYCLVFSTSANPCNRSSCTKNPSWNHSGLNKAQKPEEERKEKNICLPEPGALKSKKPPLASTHRGSPPHEHKRRMCRIQ